MPEDFSYTGTKSLEILQDAVNYNNFIETEILKFIGTEDKTIDFGAGIGEFAKRTRAKNVAVTCIELDNELREHLKKNNFPAYSSLAESPSHSRIYSLNVLEHIEDDIAALRDIHSNLTPDGKLLLYVPAFMCLYTEFDKNIGHFRRYRKKELEEKLNQTGFKIERSEYVDSIGFVCWFIMGKLPTKKDTINPTMVKIFDRILFPLSRLFDNIFNCLFGKNLLIIASKT